MRILKNWPLLIGVCWFLILIMLSWESPWYNDERVHFLQSMMFANGNFHMMEVITTFPGYHALLALPAKIFGVADQREWYRAFVAFYSFFGVIAAWFIAGKFHPKQRIVRWLQFLFLPFVMSFSSQIHTEGIATALVLVSVAFTLHKRYFWAMAIITLSILTRQQNIIWAAFIPLLAASESETNPLSKNGIIWLFKQFWPLALVAISFFIFVLINGGVAIGDKANHTVGLFINNHYYFLFVCFLVFFPLLFGAIKTAINTTTIRKILFGALGLTAFGLIYYFFFELNHPFFYRGLFGRNAGDFSLLFSRGGSLKMFIVDNIRLTPGWALAFFGMSTAGLFTLIQQKWSSPAIMWIVAMTILVLLPQEFISSRYYTIPLSLLVLFRSSKDEVTEWTLFGYFLCFSLLIVYGLYLSPIRIFAA